MALLVLLEICLMFGLQEDSQILISAPVNHSVSTVCFS
jgi:hypothetical protein